MNDFPWGAKVDLIIEKTYKASIERPRVVKVIHVSLENTSARPWEVMLTSFCSRNQTEFPVSTTWQASRKAGIFFSSFS